MKTGYFSNPKYPNAERIVHVVSNEHTPLCGTSTKNRVFLWCADGIIKDYVSCSKCREHAEVLLFMNRNLNLPDGSILSLNQGYLIKNQGYLIKMPLDMRKPIVSKWSDGTTTLEFYSETFKMDYDSFEFNVKKQRKEITLPEAGDFTIKKLPKVFSQYTNGEKWIFLVK